MTTAVGAGIEDYMARVTNAVSVRELEQQIRGIVKQHTEPELLPQVERSPLLGLIRILCQQRLMWINRALGSKRGESETLEKFNQSLRETISTTSLAVAAEREECAAIAQYREPEQPEGKSIADAIRARSDAAQAEGNADFMYSTTPTDRWTAEPEIANGSVKSDLQQIYESKARLTDLYPHGILAGGGHIYTEPEPIIANGEKPILRSDEGKRVLVGDTYYGLTADCQPVRYPNLDSIPVNQVDLTFAAPVAAYIKENGWKWEDVQVREYMHRFSTENKGQVFYINTAKGIALAYDHDRNVWSAPIR